MHKPEITSQQTNIEKRRARETEHDWREGIEYRQAEGISDDVARHGPVPRRGPETRSVKDPRLRAVDDHAPEAELADDLV